MDTEILNKQPHQSLYNMGNQLKLLLSDEIHNMIACFFIFNILSLLLH